MLRSFSLTRGLFPFIFLRFITCVKAKTKCGTSYCGEKGYCCFFNKNKCCYRTIIFRLWWLWPILIPMIIFIICSFYMCWKSRYRSTQTMYASRTYIVNPVPGSYPVWGPQLPSPAYGVQGPHTVVLQPVPPPYNAQAPPYTPNTANIPNTSNTQNAPNSSPN